MKIWLSAFADEASAEFGEQLRVLREERIPYIELRGVDGKNISELTLPETEGYAKAAAQAGILVWALGSPLGKIGVQDDFRPHLEQAERLFRLASVFGTDKVRVFSFYTETPEADEAEVFGRMRALAALAARFGVTLYHENEKGIYGSTAARCAKLLAAVPGLKSVFDPANYVQCGEDVPSALRLLGAETGYYHIKDALYADGEVVPAGSGDGCLRQVVGGIARDTVLTLEPHLAVFEGYSHLERTAQKQKFGYRTSREAFAAAAAALRGLLQESGFEEGEGVWKK